MRKNTLELYVGIFVLLGVAAIAYLALRLGAGASLGADTYAIEARFANSGGLHSGGSVMLSGVTIGRVESVRIDPADYSAIVEMRIRSGLGLPSDTMASVKTSGLIGDKYVALSPGADDTNLEPGSRITMTESAVDLEALVGKMAFGAVGEGEAAPSPTPDSP